MNRLSKGKRSATNKSKLANSARGMRLSSLALEEQSALLSAVFARSPDGMAFVDADSIVRAANQSLAKQVQIPLSRILGSAIGELVPRLMQEIASIFEVVRETGEPFQVESYLFQFKSRPRRGLTYWDSTISPVYAADGSFLGYLVLLREVTERKLAQEERERLASEQAARAEAEARTRQLEAVIEAVPDGVLVVDRQGSAVARNTALLELIGISNPYHILGSIQEFSPLFDVFGHDGRALPLEEWGISRALRGESGLISEGRLRLRDGRERLVQTCSAPMFDDQGEVVQAVAVMRDVTHLRRLERRREVISQIGQALSQGLDLNTVLQTVADESLQVLGADAVNVMLADEERRELVMSAFRTLSAEPIELLRRVPFDAQILAARAFTTGEIQVIEDVPMAGPELAGTRGLAETDDAHSFVSVPLRAGTRTVGAMTIISRALRGFAPEDVETISRMADMCGMAIENARLYQETQRRAAELDATISSIADGLVIFGPDGEVLEMNPSANSILGYSESERRLSPAQRLALLRAEMADGRPCAGEDSPVQRALRGDVVRGELLKLYLSGERTVWVGVNSAPICSPDGKLLGAVSSFTDVTERHNAREELQRLIAEIQSHADELDALIDSMAEGVLVADGQGNVVRINRAGRQILGLRGPESVSQAVDLLHEAFTISSNGRPLLKDEWPIIRTLRGETFAQQEIVWTGPEGDARNLLVSGSAVWNADGKIVLGVNVFRDITPIRELEWEREEFVSAVAHELRGAMTTVRGYAEYLTRPGLAGDLPDSVKRAVEAISSSSRRVERMVSDLLDVSRIEAHRLALDKEPAHLPDLVQDIIFRSNELVKGRPVKVKVHGVVPPVEVDADRIEQVLMNLLSNAEKYSYPDTEIRVEVEAWPGDVMVSVTNLGHGVSPREQEKLFHRFSRTHRAIEEKIPGLGLGLYIARGLAEAHGGRIWVESEPEKHTTFRFTLPTG